MCGAAAPDGCGWAAVLVWVSWAGEGLEVDDGWYQRGSLISWWEEGEDLRISIGSNWRLPPILHAHAPQRCIAVVMPAKGT